jgi:hypothetical protein
VQPSIAQTYFSEPEGRTRNDVESSYASLRGTLKSLQVQLFLSVFTLCLADACNPVINIPNLQYPCTGLCRVKGGCSAIFCQSNLTQREKEWFAGELWINGAPFTIPD